MTWLMPSPMMLTRKEGHEAMTLAPPEGAAKGPDAVPKEVAADRRREREGVRHVEVEAANSFRTMRRRSRRRSRWPRRRPNLMNWRMILRLLSAKGVHEAGRRAGLGQRFVPLLASWAGAPSRCAARTHRAAAPRGVISACAAKPGKNTRNRRQMSTRDRGRRDGRGSLGMLSRRRGRGAALSSRLGPCGQAGRAGSSRRSASPEPPCRGPRGCPVRPARCGRPGCPGCPGPGRAATRPVAPKSAAGDVPERRREEDQIGGQADGPCLGAHVDVEVVGVSQRVVPAGAGCIRGRPWRSCRCPPRSTGAPPTCASRPTSGRPAPPWRSCRRSP